MAEKEIKKAAQPKNNNEKAGSESTYTVKELSGHAMELFGRTPECVRAACTYYGKSDQKMTVREAKNLVDKYMGLEVRG